MLGPSSRYKLIRINDFAVFAVLTLTPLTHDEREATFFFITQVDYMWGCGVGQILAKSFLFNLQDLGVLGEIN